MVYEWDIFMGFDISCPFIVILRGILFGIFKHNIAFFESRVFGFDLPK